MPMFITFLFSFLFFLLKLAVLLSSVDSSNFFLLFLSLKYITVSSPLGSM